GAVTFDPLPTFTGTATPVTYRVTDQDGVTDTATITITVTPITPNAVDDATTTPQDVNRVIDVLANDTPGDPSAPLDPTSVVFPTTGQPAGATISPDGKTLAVPGEGTYTVEPTTGVVTFDPAPTFTGETTPVTYRVTDDNGTRDTATLTVAVSGPPTAVNDTGTTRQDTDVTVNPLTNDTPGSGGGAPLDPTSVVFPTAGQPAGSTVSPDGRTLTVPGQGTYTVNPTTGAVTFDPAPTFTGTTAPVTYRVADDNGTTATATITLTVTPIRPVATDDTGSAPNGRPITIDLLANDEPGDPSAPLDPTSVVFPATGQPAGATVSSDGRTLTVPGEGTYTIDPTTGAVTFDPEPTFSGVGTPVTYRVADDNGSTATATITVTTGEPPAASPDAATTAQDVTITVPVLANDDPGSSPFDPATVRLRDPADGSFATTVVIPGEGTYRANPDGSVTFDPEPAFSGTTTPLTYQVADDDGLTTTASLTITVTPIPPAARPDTDRTVQGLPVTVAVLGNDTASPGIPLVPSTVRLRDPATGAAVTTLTVAGEGTYVVEDDGRVTFGPDPLFTGTATPVTYVVGDSLAREVSTTLTITVDPSRIAEDDRAVGRPGQPVVVDVLGNDTIVPGVPLDRSTLRLVDPETGELVTRLVVAGEGVWTVDLENGTLVFTAEPGFTGVTSPVTYYVEDVEGRSTTAEARVEIVGAAGSPPRPPGAAPTAPVRPSTGPLASTGASVALAGALGTGIVILGMVLVRASRRRRDDEATG
ncbi:MAG: Ig-like domain-containing protein, partial [Dermatophilaceae bacterium]